MEFRKLMRLLTLFAVIALIPFAFQSAIAIGSTNSTLSIQHESYYSSCIQHTSNFVFILNYTVNSSSYHEKINFTNNYAYKHFYVNITSLQSGGFLLNASLPNIFKVIYNPSNTCFTIWAGNLTDNVVSLYRVPMTGILKIVYITPDGQQYLSVNLTNIKFGSSYVTKVNMIDYKPEVIFLGMSKISATQLSVQYNRSIVEIHEDVVKTFPLSQTTIYEGNAISPALVLSTMNTFFTEIFGINGKLTMVSFLHNLKNGTLVYGFSDGKLYSGTSAYSADYDGQKIILVPTDAGVESSIPLEMSLSGNNFYVVKIDNSAILIYPNGTYTEANIFPLAKYNYSFIINNNGAFNVEEYVSPNNGIGYINGNVTLYYQNMTQIINVYHTNNLTFVHVTKGEVIIEKTGASALSEMILQNIPFLFVALLMAIGVSVVAYFISKS